MSLILRNTPATLELQVYNNGTLTNLAATPTLVLTDGNGATVSSGAVTKPGSTTGIYRSVLPGQANLKLFDAAWSGTLSGEPVVLYQDYEIVGRLLFTEADARAFGAKADANLIDKPLNDEAAYLDAVIAAERDRITFEFEQATGRSWIPRYCRARYAGTGSNYLDLSGGYPTVSGGGRISRPGIGWDINRIISATADGASINTANLEIHDYKLYQTTGTWPSPGSSSTPLNVVVEFEYGHTDNVDGVDRIALKELVDRLVPSGYPDRAISWDMGAGSIRMVQAGGPLGNFSRVPDVNAWISGHDQRVSVA